MKKFLLFTFILVSLFSCTKQDRENNIADQEKRIDSYIEGLNPVRIQKNAGVSRLVFKEGIGTDSLSVGDSVKLYYSGHIFSRGKGKLFVTNVDSVARANGFECMMAPLGLKLEKGSMIDGLYYGLQGAKVGEKCELVFSSKYGYGNTVVYNIPKLTPLIFEIEIVEITKN